MRSRSSTWRAPTREESLASWFNAGLLAPSVQLEAGGLSLVAAAQCVRLGGPGGTARRAEASRKTAASAVLTGLGPLAVPGSSARGQSRRNVKRGHADHHGLGQFDVTALRIIGVKARHEARDVEHIAGHPAPQAQALIRRKRNETAGDFPSTEGAKQRFPPLQAQSAGEPVRRDEFHNAQAYAEPTQRACEAIRTIQRTRSGSENLRITFRAHELSNPMHDVFLAGQGFKTTLMQPCRSGF